MRWVCHLTCRDGDEMGVSFNRSQLSFETVTEILLSNVYCSTFSGRQQPTMVKC